ncbi:MAG: hypothetical protein F4Z74_08915 [Acidobacteria bacterium]|nr:hypothetical protein [Acidobacteriota bacterium]MYE44925.1 hypothetical protein [Acidobacteriota bacterium]
MPRLCLTLLLIGPFGACGGEPAAPEPEPPAPDVSAAEELIARSIGYHDPAGLWDSGEIALRIMESRPNGVTRTVEVGIAPGSGAVEVRRETDAATVSFAVSGEEILRRAVDGDEELDDVALGEHGLDAERVMWLRNYYLFVWGLPMKLRDPGTIVDPEPMMDSYNGQDALKVRVTYDPEVGGDTWYFYFHPDTARMIGYRFYHDESANDGEYIHLEGEIVSGGLRLPAKRSWFFHSNEEYLGDDEAVSLTVTP